MTDDLLRAATRALKEETADTDAEGRFTRARVMASLHQGTVKRRTRLAFVLPIAACFAAGTAWGAATGRLPAAFDSLAKAIGYTSQRAPAPAAKRSAPAATNAGQAPLAVAPPPALQELASDALEPAKNAPAPVANPTAPAVVAAPKAGAADSERAPSAAVAKSASVAPPPSAAFQDTDGDLYRLAHEAHFARHDYARALAGWDAYLRAAPGGRLATEARYNRALCLLRLGRDAEAKTALEPFASGKLGGYRQNEARELLRELGSPAD